MRKIVLVLAVLFMAGLSANAYIDTQYMTTPQYLQNTGFSSEMSRLMAITNKDPYREPHVEKHNFKNVMKRAYSYIAPGMYTDIDFYNHNGNFNNTSWKDL